MPDWRLPRQLGDDAPAIEVALATAPRPLWPGGTLAVPVLPFREPLVAALRLARRRDQLGRGLEAATDALAAEERGLAANAQRSGQAPGERISRLLLFTTDGAERFYRQVERCLHTHGARVLGCFVATDSGTLATTLFGEATAVKLVFLQHKDAVAAVLRSVIAD